MKILFLSANPKKAKRLGFDKEFYEIRGSILASEARNKVSLAFRADVTPKNVQQHIEKEKPDIIHFSGHGNSKGEIVLEGEKGYPKPIPAEEFANVFKGAENQVKCVVLNYCYSAKAAKEIGRIVDCVIGMKTDLEDDSAVAFASAFYLALGENKDLQLAFDFAVSQFLLKGGLVEEKPELFVRPTIIPSEIYLI